MKNVKISQLSLYVTRKLYNNDKQYSKGAEFSAWKFKETKFLKNLVSFFWI